MIFYEIEMFGAKNDNHSGETANASASDTDDDDDEEEEDI